MIRAIAIWSLVLALLILVGVVNPPLGVFLLSTLILLGVGSFVWIHANHWGGGRRGGRR